MTDAGDESEDSTALLVAIGLIVLLLVGIALVTVSMLVRSRGSRRRKEEARAAAVVQKKPAYKFGGGM